jgi:hypothetical protein
MANTYGRRHGLTDLRLGTRQLSPTFGTPLHLIQSDQISQGGAALVDGSAEQLVGQIFKIDPEILESVPQGVTVDLVDKTLLYTENERKAAKLKHRGHPGQSTWTADFLNRRRTNARDAVEVKLDLYPGAPEFLETLQQASHILKRFDCALLKLILPADQRKPIWANVPLVYQVAKRKDLYLTADELTAIEQAGTRGAETAAEFLSAIGRDINHLPVLIASGVLKVDLLAGHLKADTPAQLAYGDLRHLRLIDRLVQP